MSYYDKLAEGINFFYFVHRKGWNTPAHFHHAVEFLFAEKGEQQVIVDGESHVLREGECCFCSPWEVHSYIPQNKDTSVYVVDLARRFFSRFFEEREGKMFPRFFKFNDYSFLNSLLEIYNRECKNPKDKIDVIQGIANLLLVEFANQCDLVQVKKIGKKQGLIIDILSYVDEHYREDVSIGALAKIFQYSHAHLIRVIKEYIPEPWPNYVNRIRILAAHKLLMGDNELSVNSIAQKCGFKSMQTFYRTYKGYYDKLPRR